eukprot:Amastigsp_a509405_127.p3 type:complete len:133 gc:universal Amastigsp_a509405_127:682-1080(+)
MAAPQPNSCVRPSGGRLRSWVPHPSSAGWTPSDAKPSTDQVLTNSPGSLGTADACVSRSAMWIVLMPRRAARAAHSSRVVGVATSSSRSAAMLSSATLTKCETSPGLAPCVITAVAPPGRSLRTASAASRCA